MDRIEVFFLRHGEVDSPQGVFYGQMDVPLSQRGREQSLKSAERLSRLKLDRILSSDLSRCIHTVKNVKGFPDNRIIIEPALREIYFGRWQGLSWDEIEGKWPGEMQRRMNELATYRPPGGESLSDLWNRSKDVLLRCLDGHYGKRVAIVAHGGINRVFMCMLLGIDLQNLFSFQQDYACFNRVDSYSDGLRVLRFVNCTCHLEGL